MEHSIATKQVERNVKSKSRYEVMCGKPWGLIVETNSECVFTKSFCVMCMILKTHLSLFYLELTNYSDHNKLFYIFVKL